METDTPLLVLTVAVAAPCLAVVAVRGAAHRTTAHLRGTLLIPLTRHAPAMKTLPDRAHLPESVAPFHVLAALEGPPGRPVLCREPAGDEVGWPVRAPRLRALLHVRTRIVGPSAGRGEWREVTAGPGRPAAPGTPPDGPR